MNIQSMSNDLADNRNRHNAPDRVHRMICIKQLIVVLFISITLLSMVGCDDLPTRDNPYDPEYNWAPTGVDLAKISDTRIDIHWNDTTKGKASFLIDRKVNDNNWVSGYASVSNSSNSYRTYSDNEVIAGNTYQYRIRGVQGGAYSNYTYSTSLYIQGRLITFNNTTHTVIHIKFNGASSYTSIPIDGSVQFSISSSASTYSFYAYTSETTSGGIEIGEAPAWQYTYNSNTTIVNLSISSTFYYLYIYNNTTAHCLDEVWVNYGLSHSCDVTGIYIPNGGASYCIGYFYALPGTSNRTRAYYYNSTSYCYWDGYALPGTSNQDKTLNNSYKRGQSGYEPDSLVPETTIPDQTDSSKILKVRNQNVQKVIINRPYNDLSLMSESNVIRKGEEK